MILPPSFTEGISPLLMRWYTQLLPIPNSWHTSGIESRSKPLPLWGRTCCCSPASSSSNSTIALSNSSRALRRLSKARLSCRDRLLRLSTIGDILHISPLYYFYARAAERNCLINSWRASRPWVLVVPDGKIGLLGSVLPA